MGKVLDFSRDRGRDDVPPDPRGPRLTLALRQLPPEDGPGLTAEDLAESARLLDETIANFARRDGDEP